MLATRTSDLSTAHAEFETAMTAFEDDHDSDVFDDPDNDAIEERFVAAVRKMLFTPAATLDDIGIKLEVIDGMQIEPGDGVYEGAAIRAALHVDIDALGPDAAAMIGRIFDFHNWLSS